MFMVTQRVSQTAALARRAVRQVFSKGGAVIAIIAAVALTGAAWRGLAASDAQTAPSQPTASAPPAVHGANGLRDSFADVVKVAAPSVVTIRTEAKAKASPTDFGPFSDDPLFRRFFGESDGRSTAPRAPMARALGSGVIVQSDGYILTNDHVIDGAEDIRVDLPDGRTLTAKLVGADKPSDLALLKVNASGLQPLALGNSDSVQVGDVVLALGNPLGVGETVTMGIVSAKGRSTGVGDGSYEDFLQTDAPINRGNSGGALVNAKGELIGINSQILSTSEGNIGIGFAIPANMASHVMNELMKNGHVNRAALGVTVQPITSDLAASLDLKQVGGALIDSVDPDGAAASAGLKRGDVIESFDGEPVRDTNSLRNRVAEADPGSTAALVVLRDGVERHLTVKLGEAPSSRARAANDTEGNGQSALGVTVAPLTPEMAARVGAGSGVHGVVVEEVDPSGRAAEAGIQSGDVIEEVNHQKVGSADDLRAALRPANGKPMLLLVNRGGRDVFLTVRRANG